MIELKSREQLERAIARAKAESKNLIVRLTNAVRIYRVENRKNGNVYTVNFFVRNNRRFGSCDCRAGQEGMACKHLAAAAALNSYLAEQGALKRKAVSQTR